MTTPSVPLILSLYPQLQPPQTIDYTSKDFLGFITSMLIYANQVMPDWNTNSEGDMGVMIAELMAYVGDILSYYGDRLTQEAYLPTATQRLSILNLAQLLGYVPSNGAPASGSVTFQTDSTAPLTVVPQGTQVSTTQTVAVIDSPVIYQTVADCSVPATGGTNSVGVIQGITYDLVQLGASDGTPAQEFQIPNPYVQDGSVQVYIQAILGNTEWSYTQFLADAGPDDTVFSTFTDANNNTWVQFGDNVNGAIPAIGLIIYTTYTVITGSAGNVPAGSVGVLVTEIPGVSIPLQSGSSVLYNSTAMTGGADPETNDQIRVNAPAAWRTQQRAVSLQDFSDLALNVPGVLMANAVANHNTSVGLYVLGPNYQAPDSGLQSNILQYFSGKTIAGVSLSVLNPNLIAVDIGSTGSPCTLQVAPNYALGTVVQQVTQALQILLSPPNSQFGELLTLSDIMGTIMAIPGVVYCIVPLFTREDVTQTNTNSIQFRQSEIPVAGNIYLTASGGLGT